MRPAGRSYRLRVLISLAGLVVVFASGCGAQTEDSPGDAGGPAAENKAGSTGYVSSPVDRARARAKAAREARQARAEARRTARRERAAERRAARKARAKIRQIRIRASALARSGGDVDCGDFASQARAQLYLVEGDPFGLDGDGDGVACADLPCPCSSEAGGGGGGGDSSAGTGAEPPRRFRGTVVDVADGDTLDVTTPSGTVETVRVIGIDTPEVYGGRECGGPAASAAMKQLATGATVTVTADPTQDRRDHYGRLLAYIDRGSQDLGFTLVRRGLASAYPYDGPFLRYPRYRRADRQARESGRGSWANCDISPG